MRPEVLRKIRDLVKAGATVLGPPPSRSPSLENFPKCDDGGAQARRRNLGRCQPEAAGRTPVWQRPRRLGQVPGGGSGLARSPDFESSAKLRFTHRRNGDTDIYFVANPKAESLTTTAAFRVGQQSAGTVVAGFRTDRASGGLRRGGWRGADAVVLRAPRLGVAGDDRLHRAEERAQRVHELRRHLPAVGVDGRPRCAPADPADARTAEVRRGRVPHQQGHRGHLRPLHQGVQRRDRAAEERAAATQSRAAEDADGNADEAAGRPAEGSRRSRPTCRWKPRSSRPTCSWRSRKAR